MTDKDIVAAVRDGELERAFGGIVSLYKERLYWHVRSIVSSHEDSDDVLQDIFIKIWTALPSYRGEAQLFTWLYRIATNEALNFLRRKKVRSALSFLQLDSRKSEVPDDPFFNGDEAQRVLFGALSRLPAKQRLVFTMRYFDDMKYEDISRILDTSVGSLKASYHIAYEKIKQELKKNF